MMDQLPDMTRFSCWSCHIIPLAWWGKFNHVVPVAPRSMLSNQQKLLVWPWRVRVRLMNNGEGPCQVLSGVPRYEMCMSAAAMFAAGPHGVSSDRGLFVQELLFAFLCLLALTASWGAFTLAGTSSRAQSKCLFSNCRGIIRYFSHTRITVSTWKEVTLSRVEHMIAFSSHNHKPRHWSETQPQAAQFTWVFPFQLELDSSNFFNWGNVTW